MQVAMWNCYSINLAPWASLHLSFIRMRLQGRLRLWMLVSMLYLCVMGIVYLFNIPLRSRTIHSHYDLSGDGVHQKHHSLIRQEANKIAKSILALKKPIGKDKQTSILKETFKKADGNDDGILELDELSGWISLKVKEHLTLALRENFFMFTAIDQNPRNGVVTWDEYYYFFLKQHGFDDEFIKNHKHHTKGMSRELKEAIMRDKAQWSEAARDDPDKLTIDEFLAFRHPESSHANILQAVEEMLDRLDIDGDNVISIQEFSDPAVNDVPDYLTDEQFRNERMQEFRNNVDADRNGKVNKMELLTYIDPRSFHHSEKDAANLVSVADKNRDGVLTLDEVLDNPKLFMTSKMVDASISFHDEF